jgi:hypothetical protein
VEQGKMTEEKFLERIGKLIQMKNFKILISFKQEEKKRK